MNSMGALCVLAMIVYAAREVQTLLWVFLSPSLSRTRTDLLLVLTTTCDVTSMSPN